ncbi:hypothetical protein [Lelliottia amnigena]|uniref:hypothetical protein n=1 Tax=Lelliottia amnigena TaxID=61646 RepID=UPI001C2439CD|nr:hypothetical protein [Lelliottia amnigena]QXB24007.1 hypothetical protein I6L76_03705 [Lelliottia amnigena]
MIMATQMRIEPVKKLCHPSDSNLAARKEPTTSVPDSWKLSAQQQAFIDTFAEDEPKKK